MIFASMLLAGLSACANRAVAPPRVAAPPPGSGARVVDPVRPVDPVAYPGQDRLYQDEPIMIERPPEQRAFIDAYNAVGRPRITLFVNRTLEGQLLPVVENDPVIAVERARRATTGASVERRDETVFEDRWRDERRERVDRFETIGPGEVRETTEVYLRPDEYDQIAARQLDYLAIEAIMTDWLAANGNTVIMSPTMVRQRLTDEQVQAIEQGRPQVLREVAQQLDTDVLVQVQARPTRQSPQGLHVRVIAEAFNIEGGQSIGRAVVDIPPPLQKTTINKYTRFLARKLMDDMIGSWSAPPEPVDAPDPTAQPE